jgi:glutathione S-transferase
MSLQLLIANKNYSSWSVRPWLVLKHFGIGFETVVAALYQDESAQATIRSWSDAGKVPVLRDGGLTVWESLAIIEYLADKFPGLEIWPAYPEERARARAVSAEMHAGFTAMRNELPMNARRRYDGFRYSDEAAADIGRVQRLWNDCLSHSNGPFLFGPFCAADAMFAPVKPVPDLWRAHGPGIGRLCRCGMERARCRRMARGRGGRAGCDRQVRILSGAR